MHIATRGCVFQFKGSAFGGERYRVNRSLRVDPGSLVDNVGDEPPTIGSGDRHVDPCSPTKDTQLRFLPMIMGLKMGAVYLQRQ